MAYSIVGILAIAIHIIANLDILHDIGKAERFSGEKYYFLFLLAVISYHITDGFWGFLYDAHLVTALFIDTTIYFVTMAASILLWGLFIYHYLQQRNRVIVYASISIFVFQIAVVIINLLVPLLFEISPDCVYSALPFRYVVLLVQILGFLIAAGCTFIGSRHENGSMKRHHITTGVFSLFMIAAITLQVFFPLLPMYSIGYLLGICALHSLVVEDERKSRQSQLDEAYIRVSIDSLTGAMSKYAYVDAEAKIDSQIDNGELGPMATVVFDLNDLKKINDTKGHQAGDKYIIDSVKLIKEYFRNIPVYRVGGDEFAVIITGDDYERKEAMLRAFNEKIDDNVEKGNIIVISAGAADYDPERDSTIIQVFTRADREMFVRKRSLKERQAQKK